MGSELGQELEPKMAPKVDDEQTLPSKEAALFRTLVKQYEVREEALTVGACPLPSPDVTRRLSKSTVLQLHWRPMFV